MGVGCHRESARSAAWPSCLTATLQCPCPTCQTPTGLSPERFGDEPEAALVLVTVVPAGPRIRSRAANPAPPSQLCAPSAFLGRRAPREALSSGSDLLGHAYQRPERCRVWEPMQSSLTSSSGPREPTVAPGNLCATPAGRTFSLRALQAPALELEVSLGGGHGSLRRRGIRGPFRPG